MGCLPRDVLLLCVRILNNWASSWGSLWRLFSAATVLKTIRAEQFYSLEWCEYRLWRHGFVVFQLGEQSCGCEKRISSPNLRAGIWWGNKQEEARAWLGPGSPDCCSIHTPHCPPLPPARLLVFRMYANQFGNYTKLKFPYRDGAC